MSGLIFIARLVLGAVAFFYLVLLWTWKPFITPDISVLNTLISVFWGSSEPSGWARDLLLLSRGFLGFAVTLFFWVPALKLFVEFRAAMWNNTIAIVLVGGSVVSFFAALIIQQLYHL